MSSFYIESTIRPPHIRVKEHLNARESSFHKHLIKCKNNDNNFSIKIEAIVHNVGNHRINWAIGLMSRVFANGLREQVSIPGRVIPKTQKNVLDATLLNTQHYKVRIKGKVEQSREKSTALPLHHSVVATEKGAIMSPSTKVANFTFTLLHSQINSRLELNTEYIIN